MEDELGTDVDLFAVFFLWDALIVPEEKKLYGKTTGAGIITG